MPVTVLDRPNPIGCSRREGPMLEADFTSFVGLKPLPIRHGLTIGELATLFSSEMPTLELTVIAMSGCAAGDGYSRDMYFDQTALPWVMPSPNMPTLDTALVYPGGCLLEGTNLSEGRGSTKPFEMLGAPFIDGWELAKRLEQLKVPGCHFRPVEFQPTSNKWAGEVCGGVFVHVTDRGSFCPVLTYVAILREARRLYGERLEWRKGPYEYEYERRPIDILAGNSWFAECIDKLLPLQEIAELMQVGLSDFEPLAGAAQMY